MTGKIVKGIAGFYYVDVPDLGIYECRAKGIFRNKKLKPLIGDDVVIEVTHEGDMEGNVVEILPRKNSLVRPTVSNVDQAFIVFAVSHPDPNLNLLDRFLVAVAVNDIEAIVCFNKTDLLGEEERNQLIDIYKKAGYETMAISAHEDDSFEEIEGLLKGKTTVFAGPSGVGKSSIINLIQVHTHMETGQVSDKIKRGKHTTRHANLIPMDDHSYVVDTPGFSSLQLNELMEEELKNYFIEFERFEPECKFRGCNHVNEPSCGIKNAVENGQISQSRYESYLHIYEELKDIRRY